MSDSLPTPQKLTASTQEGPEEIPPPPTVAAFHAARFRDQVEHLTDALDRLGADPLDEEAVLDVVRRTSKVILLHETTRTLGPAAELAALIAEKAFEYLDGPLVRVTAPDSPVPFSPPLEKAWLPGAPQVLAAARKLLAW